MSASLPLSEPPQVSCRSQTGLGSRRRTFALSSRISVSSSPVAPWRSPRSTSDCTCQRRTDSCPTPFRLAIASDAYGHVRALMQVPDHLRHTAPLHLRIDLRRHGDLLLDSQGGGTDPGWGASTSGPTANSSTPSSTQRSAASDRSDIDAATSRSASHIRAPMVPTNRAPRRRRHPQRPSHHLSDQQPPRTSRHPRAHQAKPPLHPAQPHLATTGTRTTSTSTMGTVTQEGLMAVHGRPAPFGRRPPMRSSV